MKAGRLASRIIGACLVLALVSPPVQAYARDNDDRDGRGGRHERDRGPEWRRDDERRNDRDWRDDRRGRDDWRDRDDRRDRSDPRWSRNRSYNPPGWHRTYRNVVVVRPYGHRYHGYGHYHDDSSAFAWLGLTAITLTILNELNEAQQRTLETAQIHATTAPIGQPVVWSDGAATGQVVALREGRTLDGMYCREFQQTVIIGGRAEEAYGTACMQPDGSWMIVDQ